MSASATTSSTHQTQAGRTPRLDRWFSRIGAAWRLVGVTLLLLLLVEAAAQFIFAQRDRVELKRLTKRSALAQASWLPELHRQQAQAQASNWEPFVYWRIRPYAGTLLNVDQRGLRRTVALADENAATAQEKIRVFCFGGSAMWGWLARDEHTIPSELAAAWQAEKLPPGEITNFAQIGYVTTQELIALQRELQRQNRPDVVVLFHGYNDLLSTIQNRRAGDAQHEPERAAEFHVTPLESLRLAALRSGTGRLARNVAQMFGPKNSHRHGAASFSATEIEQLAQGVVEHYAANLQTWRGMAGEHKFQALAYWQPMVFTKAPQSDDERRLVTLKPGLADLAAAVEKKLLEDFVCLDFPVRNLGGLFAATPEEVFLDEVHMTEAANAACARRIAEDVRTLVSPSGSAR